MVIQNSSLWSFSIKFFALWIANCSIIIDHFIVAAGLVCKFKETFSFPCFRSAIKRSSSRLWWTVSAEICANLYCRNAPRILDVNLNRFSNAIEYERRVRWCFSPRSKTNKVQRFRTFNRNWGSFEMICDFYLQPLVGGCVHGSQFVAWFRPNNDFQID